jgi:hypothetical protein
MKTRAEAAQYANNLMWHGVPVEQKDASHFGRVELRMLMDFIYEGKPVSAEEEIRPFSSLLDEITK